MEQLNWTKGDSVWWMEQGFVKTGKLVRIYPDIFNEKATFVVEGKQIAGFPVDRVLHRAEGEWGLGKPPDSVKPKA